MTHLFSIDERTRISGSRYNESKYSFLDTSSWPSIERVRHFWESWFEQYPEDKKSALAARFRSRDDHPHLSAFLELFVFAFLQRSGYELAVDPPSGGLALDFLAYNKSKEPLFYVECTATGRHRSQLGADALEADLLEAINKTPTGRFLLRIEVEARGAAAPATKPLRAQLEAWLASLDADEVTARVEETKRLPEWIWEKDGWRVRFVAMPTIASPDDGEGAIGMRLASFVPDQHIRLRAAMDGKASKYGELGKPLLLVLDSTEFQSDRDLMTALLGDVLWHIDFATGAVTTSRKPNGVL